ncbi:MAG: hypothetical protein WD794_05430 [Mycobacteriales bacterium]
MKNYRRGTLFASAVGAALMAMGGTAFACVTFIGQMTVDGHDGDVTVVGTGNSHAYCTQPTTAAAGHLADSITASVAPATCNNKPHQLPDGLYEVRYNNEKSYTFDGTQWTMISGTGCFLSDNSDTTTILGAMTVVDGSGSWTGTLGDPAGTDYYPPTGEAANFCVGADGKGMLAPYRLLSL